MAMPCLSCGQQIGLDLEFIIKNPTSQCPHCEVIMNFNVSSEMKKEYLKVSEQINKIKKQYRLL
jgi:hypothetical protein